MASIKLAESRDATVTFTKPEFPGCGRENRIRIVDDPAINSDSPHYFILLVLPNPVLLRGSVIGDNFPVAVLIKIDRRRHPG